MESSSHWRDEVGRLLRRSVSSVDDFVDQRWRELKSRMGWDGKARIQPYIGMANSNHLWLTGRVLSNPEPKPPTEDDTWWDNLMATYNRWESDEIPGVEVKLVLGEEQHVSTSDREGYFHFELDLKRPLAAANWHQVLLQIVGDSPVEADRGMVAATVRAAGPDASFGIISDLDDTVIHTGVTGLLTAARLTFLHNARTRTPLQGVGQLYWGLTRGHSMLDACENNPVIYVSSSPWNMFDLLFQFLQLNDVPSGPLLLRDLGFDEDKFLRAGHEHKVQKIERILRTFDQLPFILVGDSGQEDAQMYRRAVAAHPGRIRAVFIRDVDPMAESHRDRAVLRELEQLQQLGVTARLIKTSLEIATEVIELGLMHPDHLPRIAAAFSEEVKASGRLG